MKKIIILILLLFVCLNVYAENTRLFSVHGFIQLGISPLQRYWDHDNYIYHNALGEKQILFYVNLGLYLWVKEFFFIGGEIKTYMFKDTDGKSFNPFLNDYTFDVGIQFSLFTIGFRHICTHPSNALEGLEDPIISANRAYEEFYIRVEF